METDSAIRLVNSLVYKPHWSFSAERWTHRFESTIAVRVTYPAAQSERADAPAYAVEIEQGAHADFLVTVGDCDDDVDLYRRILTDVINCIDCHEAREFLRVAPTMWAPFHPHRLDGMRRWGDRHGDLAFGVI